jgi:hypothetical protein
MRNAISKLFREEPDVPEVIKLKAIYELLETIADKCEDVANLIDGVILENSRSRMGRIDGNNASGAVGGHRFGDDGCGVRLHEWVS